MFWSGETIIARLLGAVDDFKGEAVDCNAWTLTVGNRFYVSPTAKATKDGSHTIRYLADRESFIIPPGQFGFLQARETIKMPHDAMGFISMKSKQKSQGLVNISGFHVDPGFEGILVFTVFNAGPTDVHMTVGEQCFLLWFAGLDRVSTMVKASPYHDGINGRLVKNIAGQVQSISEISERLSAVEAKLSQHASFAKYTGGFLALLLALATIFSSGLQSYLTSQKPAAAPAAAQPAPPVQSAPVSPPKPAAAPSSPPPTAGAPSNAP